MKKSKFADLRKEVVEKNSNVEINESSVLPKKTPSDKRKNYTFTLTEKERKLLSKISEEQGYKSDSKFLGDLIIELAKDL